MPSTKETGNIAAPHEGGKFVPNQVGVVDLFLRKKPEESKEIKPFKIENGVEYYHEMPSPPQDMPLTILPLETEEERSFFASQGGEFRFRTESGSIINEQFGGYAYGAISKVDQESGKLHPQYDTHTWKCGPIDKKTGLATGGSVIVPIKKVKMDDGSLQYFIFFSYQFRPSAYDANKVPIPDNVDPKAWIKANRGEYMATVPSGFANSITETAKQTGLQEMSEEMPWLKPDSKVYITQTYTDRAISENPINIGYVTCEIDPTKEVPKDDHEKFFGKYAVPFGKFKTKDNLVRGAMMFAAQNLGLISSEVPQ